MIKLKDNILNLTEFGKLGVLDRILILVITFYTPLTVIFSNKLILSVLSAVLIFLNIYFWKRSGKQKRKPFLYKTFAWDFTLCVIAVIVSTTLRIFNFEFVAMLALVFAMYFYLFIMVFFVYYILNLIYISILKKVFPNEGEKVDVNRPNMKELSRYIELDTQKNYLTISLLEIFIYMLFSAFVLGVLAKYVPFTDQTPLHEISSWANRQEYLTVFNGVTLFSLMVTIYTITIPWKKKIRNEAEEKYQN